jgi:2-oxoglutarate dehydrogenase E2 component (dihydrolipoamide succinyltransferase)
MAAGSGSKVSIVVPAEQEGTRAVVKHWLKNAGDRVSKDEPVLELETDKVVLEVPAPAAGVLESVLVKAGAEVEPGTVLGILSTAPTARAAPPGTAARPATAGDRARPAAAPAQAEHRLSPAVRALVAEHRLDPSRLAGTGQGGRVTRADVLEALKSQGRASAVGRPVAATAAPRSRRIEHDSMRRKIAEHMLRSVNTAPHVTAVFEADFSAVAAHRNAAQPELERQGVKLTYTAYLVAASVAAMKAAPTVNSRWHDDFLEIFDDVNVGVGTALGDAGLIVPVIHKAQDLSLAEIAARLQDLTSRARAMTLKPADVQGGTFSISNHGVSGSLLAAPIIINQPQSAILGVGALERRVVVRTVDGADSIEVRPMAYVSLTIDHRVIDGAQTNAWLTRFVEAIERWPDATA